MQGIRTTTPEQTVEIIKMYESGLSSNKIQDKTGIKASTICGILRRNNIKRHSNIFNSRRYTLNQHFFDKITTEKQAYWLGFIFADGYVHKNGVRIILAIKDRKHLEKFNKDIVSNCPIKDRINDNDFGRFWQSRISICSQYIKKSLNSLGLDNKKTWLGRVPELKTSINKHFWRGMIDGDGSVAITIEHNRKILKVSLSGNKSVTQSFCDFIRQELDININPYKDKSIFCCATKCGKAQRILDLLYKNSSVFLDRKYKNYIDSTKLKYKKLTKRNYSKEFLTQQYEEYKSWRAVARGLNMEHSNLTLIRKKLDMPIQSTIQVRI